MPVLREFNTKGLKIPQGYIHAWRSMVSTSMAD